MCSSTSPLLRAEFMSLPKVSATLCTQLHWVQILELPCLSPNLRAAMPPMTTDWSSSTLSHSFRILQIAQFELALFWQVSGWHRCFIYDLTVLIFMIRMVCFLVSLRKWVSHDNVLSSWFRVIRKTLTDNIIVYLLLLSAVLCALWILPHLIFPFTLISRHGGVGVGELEGWQLKVGCGPFCEIQEA